MISKKNIEALEQTITNLTAELDQKNQLITHLQQQQQERTNNKILNQITKIRQDVIKMKN